MSREFITNLIQSSESKIVLLVMDGLGGLPMNSGGLTELETAVTPNMDRLASEGELGQTIPVKPGITPGSGPAHLALFGYDPLVHDVGRGALSAAGVDHPINPGDVAARGNFCTLDAEGKIIDRRAGRIPSEESKSIVDILNNVQIPEVQVVVHQVKEYRFVIIMKGEGLDPNLTDTDPQTTGVKPLPVRAEVSVAEKTAYYFNQWISEACKAVAHEPKANGITLRGFATDPGLPTYRDAYGLNAACIAGYPMYKGVSRLVGMDIIEFEGDQPSDQFSALNEVWQNYDFFFIHIKKTDSMGEDGNFDGKVKIIEHVDEALPKLLSFNPDVLIITGDHSTPAALRSHSWHPVPLLLWAPGMVRPETTVKFGERACARGSLGTIPAMEIMPLALGYSNRLMKYGA